MGNLPPGHHSHSAWTAGSQPMGHLWGSRKAVQLAKLGTPCQPSILTIDLAARAPDLLVNEFVGARRIQGLTNAHRGLVEMAGPALWYM